MVRQVQGGRREGPANPSLRQRRDPTTRAFRPQAADPTPPRKASKLQARANRTSNRHRWAGRAFPGARDRPRQGTLQIESVTSGEGLPASGGPPRGASRGRPQKRGPGDCLPKTQRHANARAEVYGVTPARCRKVKGSCQARAEAPNRSPGKRRP